MVYLPLVLWLYIALFMKCSSFHAIYLYPRVNGEVRGKWPFLSLEIYLGTGRSSGCSLQNEQAFIWKINSIPTAPKGKIAWADQRLEWAVLRGPCCCSAAEAQAHSPLWVCWQLFHGTVWGVESPVSETEKCFHTWSVISHLVFLSR